MECLRGVVVGLGTKLSIGGKNRLCIASTNGKSSARVRRNTCDRQDTTVMGCTQQHKQYYHPINIVQQVKLTSSQPDISALFA